MGILDSGQTGNMRQLRDLRGPPSLGIASEAAIPKRVGFGAGSPSQANAWDIQPHLVEAASSAEVQGLSIVIPQAMLWGCFGTITVPKCLPSGEMIHKPPGPDTYNLPRWSTFLLSSASSPGADVAIEAEEANGAGAWHPLPEPLRRNSGVTKAWNFLTLRNNSP